MHVSIATENTSPLVQSLSQDWYGAEVFPPVSFSFALVGGCLRFAMWRQAPARPHPEGKPGMYQENLWHYDTAEFFLASKDRSRYLEFNLSPAGAWWGCVFVGPRVPDPRVGRPIGVLAYGSCRQEGWRCQADIPLAWLQSAGLEVRHARLAAAAVLNTPNDRYLTSAEHGLGKPDFHVPASWPLAKLL